MIVIRKFKESDAKNVSELICETFVKFVSKDFTKKGIKNFLKHEKPQNQINRSKKRDSYVALINNKIVGVIEAVSNDRISRLFINENYQKSGIGGSLVRKIENTYKRSGLTVIKVKSSLNAQDFYLKMGYKKTRGIIKSKEGIIYQPMEKVL